MGRHWIKDGKVDKQELDKLFDKVRFGGDAISFIEWVRIFVDYVNEIEEAKQIAQDKVKRYEEEINADSRVKEIKAKYDEATKALYRGFGISQEEAEQIAAWKEKHDVERHGLNTLDKRLQAGGAIGGRYHYEFHPTSIGTVGTCVCGKCKKRALMESAGDYEKYQKLLKKYNAEFDFSEL